MSKTSNHSQPVEVEVQETEEKPEDTPSNIYLLNVAFFTFLGFTICEAVAAIYADSEAMLGDSAAMAVDAMTYAFNLCAERKKENASRKSQLLLELIPPLFSVTVLISVTMWITNDAIKTLKEISSSESSKEDYPNVTLMLIFSTLNLALDGVNVGCFATARHALGFRINEPNESSITENDGGLIEDSHSIISENAKLSQPTGGVDIPLEGEEIEDTFLVQYEGTTSLLHENLAGNQRSVQIQGIKSEESVPTNLNMCSAYTHVVADTLRSIAVVIAASIAGLDEKVNPEKADSVAAIVVSGIILISIIPLLGGIYTIVLKFFKPPNLNHLMH